MRVHVVLVFSIMFLLLTIQGALAYNSQGILNNLVSYYTFDTNTTETTKTVDSMNYTNGTAAANVFLTKGNAIIGQAALHGPTSGIDATNINNFSRMPEMSSLPSLAVSVWLRFNSTGRNMDAVYMGDVGTDYFFISGDSTGVIKCAVTTSVGGRTVLLGPTITAGVLDHYVCVYNGVNITIYKNGAFGSSVAKTGTFTFPNDDDMITGAFVSGSNSFNGSIDELGFWNVSLNTTQVSLLYNAGAGLAFCSTNFAQCTTGGAAGPNQSLIITVANEVNGSLVNGVCVYATGTNTTRSICNATGANVTIDTIGTYNLTLYSIGKGDNVSQTYFNVTIQNYVFTTTANFTQNVTQAYLNLTALKIYANTSISTFNATNGIFWNQTTGGSTIVPANNGSNNVQVKVVGNYTLNATCTVSPSLTTQACVVQNVYDEYYKFNGTEASSGDPYLTFTIHVYNETLGGKLASYSTTNGSAYVPVLRGYYYTFVFDSTSAASANVTLEANASQWNYSFSVLPQNSVFINIYDATLLTPILQNVSVSFSNGTTNFTNITNTSTLLATSLNAGTWTLGFSSQGYEDRNYFITVTEDSTQQLDAYLINSTGILVGVFTIKDRTTTNIIEGATVTLQQEIDSSWVTIDQQTSDLFGVVRFSLEDGQEYRLIATATGYATKQGEFFAVDTEYTVALTSTNTQNFTTYSDEFSYSTLPVLLTSNLTSFSLTTSSPSGSLEWFAVVVNLNGTNTTDNVTGSPSGGTAQLSVNLTNYGGYTVTAYYYIKSVSFEQPLIITRSWYIYNVTSGNYTFTDFMEYYADDDNGLSFVSRGLLLTTGGVILAALLGIVFGGAVAIVVASLVFIAGAFYGWIHWSIVIVVVGGLFGAILLKGVGR